ncbi:MAG: hypothetical protein Q8T11_18230 [Elusimicrobiota bacterium]|nr:hypothetical protein [Elusimicrobiota bacterium]
MPFGLPTFSAANIIGNLLFSGLGYVAYSYGRKMDKTKVTIQGGVLMAFSYFISDTVWMYAVGTALTVWVWASRHDA